MRTIAFGKHRTARISYEKVQSMELSWNGATEILVPARVGVPKGERFFAIELTLPANNSNYAALGAHYVPSTAECESLRMEIRREASSGTKFAFAKRTVFAGLPTEFAQVVEKAAAEYAQSTNVASGEIVFNSAAYCEVGSSPLIYRILTKIVLEVLLSEDFPLSDDDIVGICEKHLIERHAATNSGD